MTHIDHPDSPMYQPELTDMDRDKRFIGVSESRTSDDQRNISEYYEADNLSVIKIQGKLYFVEIGLGQFHDQPFHTNYLALDTGSDVVWTQCEGCSRCFQQNTPLFPRSRSQTYQPFPCRQCQGQCYQDHCTKTIGYGDGAAMSGIWATETFTFISQETVNGLSFACAIDITDFKPANSRNNMVTGILGMSKGRDSLIKQLGDRAGNKFSFCLQQRNTRVQSSPMFLSFGDYITSPAIMSTTPILGRRGFYYVGLNGVSIGGMNLNIPPQYLTLRSDYTGGTIFDTGATTSRFVPGAFEMIKDAIDRYVEYYNGDTLRKRTTPNEYGLELCWEPLYNNPQVTFPTMFIHLRNNADMLVQPTEVITKYAYPGIPRPGLYCMTIQRANADFNSIGSFQMINQRVIIDVEAAQISFAPTDCSNSNF
ncbi:aspartyl protease family protein 2-like [Silene latifolia]|uniref:aspartyl protease family protein 2-like n=1 Tax=Silene latifolia TaxID=37657 RepID=UPI003D78659C